MDLLFGQGAAWFGVPALVGTFFFMLRLAMMFMGGDTDMDADIDVDLDVDVDVDIDDLGDSTHAFEVLSFQTIASFLMGFGWAGLAAYRGEDWGFGLSVVLGAAAGTGMVWLMTKLFRLVYSLESSGNVSIKDALGVEGQVYTQIPGHREGRGQVRLVIGDRQRYFNAITDDDGLETRSRVRVVEVNNDNTVTVTKA